MIKDLCQEINIKVLTRDNVKHNTNLEYEEDEILVITRKTLALLNDLIFVARLYLKFNLIIQ